MPPAFSEMELSGGRMTAVPALALYSMPLRGMYEEPVDNYKT